MKISIAISERPAQTIETMTSPSLRLFVALQPSEPARAALSKLADEIARVQWTPREQLHLTLRFVGTVSPTQTQKIEQALARVRVRPFLLDLEGVGGFPPRGHPTVLWAAVRSHPFLHQLRQQVDDLLLTTGVPFELKPFVPHFTLGRCREAPPGVAHWLKRHRDFVGPAWPVDAFYLMSSELLSAGAVHRVVQKFPLAATPAGEA